MVEKLPVYEKIWKIKNANAWKERQLILLKEIIELEQADASRTPYIS
jgi:hypothetical protein